MKKYISKSIYLISTILILSSCNNIHKPDNETKTDIVATQKEVTKLFNEIKEQKLPYKDSTSFDNPLSGKFLNLDEVNMLHLNQLNEVATKFIIQYKLDINPNFTTVIISYYQSEHELTTELVNFDAQFKIIDHLVIAYDETAESMSKKVTLINTNDLIVSDMTFESEEPNIEKKKYTIEQNGILKKI